MGISAASIAARMDGIEASDTFAPRDRRSSIICLPLSKKLERRSDIQSVDADNAFPKSIPAMGITV